MRASAVRYTRVFFAVAWIVTATVGRADAQGAVGEVTLGPTIRVDGDPSGNGSQLDNRPTSADTGRPDVGIGGTGGDRAAVGAPRLPADIVRYAPDEHPAVVAYRDAAHRVSTEGNLELRRQNAEARTLIEETMRWRETGGPAPVWLVPALGRRLASTDAVDTRIGPAQFRIAESDLSQPTVDLLHRIQELEGVRDLMQTLILGGLAANTPLEALLDLLNADTLVSGLSGLHRATVCAIHKEVGWRRYRAAVGKENWKTDVERRFVQELYRQCGRACMGRRGRDSKQ